MWRDQAVCRDDPEPWFASDTLVQRWAQRQCRACPVQLECAEWVVELAERGQAPSAGVWAGHVWSDRQREELTA